MFFYLRQFNRDVNCIQTFFGKRYNVHFENKPKLNVDVIPKSDLTKDIEVSGYLKEIMGDHAADIQLLESYNQEEKSQEEDDEEEEQMTDVKWENDKEDNDEEKDESDENIAEERKIEEDVKMPEEKPENTIEEDKMEVEEEKKGGIDIADIKAKVKKQFKNTAKKEKVINKITYS